MSRAALILTAGLALAVPGVAAASGGSATGTPTTTVPAAVDAAVPATTTTVAGAAVTTTVPATTVPRGGAASGSVAKPEPAEGWSVQRLATLTLLGIVALAAAGYAFGRIRSTPPVHPDLARHPD